MPKTKAEHPELSHREAFTATAHKWATSEKNPKRENA